MAERGLAALPLPQLRAQLREARYANALLRTEVEMFEKWYCKMEPSGPLLPLLTEAPDAPPELTQTRGRYKSKLHGATDYFVGLTAEQKCELAERELAEMKDEIQRLKDDSEQTLQDLEDLLREKLCLKNYLLKGYKKKLQQQLRQGLQKEQMGETLCEVRLQQLQVRNAQYQEKIDEKNQELLQLKLTSGKTVQVLNFYKRKLQDAMEMSTSLMKDISQRKELLGKIEREAALVEEQRAEAESVNWQLRKQLSDYSVPSVLSYVQKKVAVTDLKNSLKAWERKAAVAEMTLQSYRRAWNQVKMSGNQQ
ncbi:coiled-coil domain-containing protein 113 isoform X5 [Chroicocephalus ridibundus]|uniref:coiled-coil domain-containing protein 113 isoform X5 n=1 Tax=Chroicocephalus ridibundus TaxID=1192867 RepID=UPI002FDEF3F0